MRSPILQLHIEADQWAHLCELARQRDNGLIVSFVQHWTGDDLRVNACMPYGVASDVTVPVTVTGKVTQ